MTKNIWFISLCMLLLTCSCINDDSTLPVNPISEITVKSESDTINIDYGYELVMDPVVEQTQEGMELKYEWMYHGFKKGGIGGKVPDSLKLLSNEKVLTHRFKKLGEYVLRLKVTNEHGSTFKKWVLNVIAPYEQGIFVLSSDENKKGRVSFMRPLTREEAASGKEEKFYTSAFTSVNPEFALNDPTDAQQMGRDLFILSRADKLVYRMDAKTFQLFSITDFKKEMEWMEPRYICSKDRSVLNYHVQSDEGSFATVDFNSDIAFESAIFYEEKPKFDKKYSRTLNAPLTSEGSVQKMRQYDFFINYETSTLYYIYDLYDWSAMQRTYEDEEIINVIMDRQGWSYMVSRLKADPEQIIIHKGQTNARGPLMYDQFFSRRYRTDNLTMDRYSIAQSNDLYNWTYYTNGNKLYRWGHNGGDLPTEPVIVLDEGCEITCFEFTQDQRRILLGVYNPNASGLKGSVYVYDADMIDQNTKELKFYKKYEGVADKPIKIFWKNNRK